jgi:hypothetical protein
VATYVERKYLKEKLPGVILCMAIITCTAGGLNPVTCNEQAATGCQDTTFSIVALNCS